MWRLLVFVGLMVASSLVLISSPGQVSANGSSWLADPITKIIEKPVDALTSDERSCGARDEVIQVEGENGYKDACVFGVFPGTRVARYREVNNQFAYAVAFPTDSDFKRIQGLCAGLANCVYGQTGDVFLLQVLGQGGVYRYVTVKNFTKYLKLVSGHFQFEFAGVHTYIKAADTDIVPRAYGVSSNGNWAVIEVVGYGLVRVDFKSMTFKRVASHDSLQESSQPLELTVSNDGRWVVAVGENTSALLYEINSSCGEALSVTSSSHFSSSTTACSFVAINLASMHAGYIAAYKPRLSQDSQRLVFNIQTQTQSLISTITSKTLSIENMLYLAFGDSFTSGEGEHDDSFYINATNTASNKCHVSSRSYPYLLASSWEFSGLNIACSGSRIPNVQDASRNFQLSSDSSWPGIISISVGGNDIDLVGKLKNCLGVGTCDIAKVGNRQAAGQEMIELFPKIVNLIKELSVDHTPMASFVVGYPSVINDTSSANCSALIGSLLSLDERRYFNEAIKQLNKVLRAAAAYTKTPYADIETAYHGERLCDDNESAMNGVRAGDDIAPIPLLGDFKLIGSESFHPTPRGHRLGANKIATELERQSFWSMIGCGDCQFNGSDIDSTSYWKEGADEGGSLIRQLAAIFLSSDVLKNVSNVAFDFLPNMFAPNSVVRFELHSDVVQLGQATASSDGSLSGILSLPGGVEGYHTLHAFGESRSGEKIDLYQTAYLEGIISSSEFEDKPVVSTVHPIQPPGLITKDASIALTISQPGLLAQAANSRLNSEQSLGSILGLTSLNGDVTFPLASKPVSPERPKNETISLSWYAIALVLLGLLLIGVSVLLSKRKTKSLPGIGNR